MVPENLNSKNARTFAAIFAKPRRANVRWADIEKLITALGGEVTKLGGSAVGLELNDQYGYFHSPHPLPDTDKGALKAVADLLERAGYDDGTS